MRFSSSALLFAIAAAACSGTPEVERACTMIGCDSGLEVRLDSAPTGDYRVEASVPGDTAAQVVECNAASPCGGSVFFRDFTPEEATIRVIAGADTVAQTTLQPTYEEMQPNGPDCPPTCRQAEVRITP